MKFLKLTFRNFASYGQKDQVIEFPVDPGFFIVQGQNGAGKSSIPDVIRFLFYGKVEGKTQKDLANRLNKNAFGRLEMNLRGKHVIIERGLEPNIMNLIIDGVPYDKANAKVGPGDYLVDELLEIPPYVFNNAICLSITDFKSFLKLSPKDKRALVDRIFGFQIISDMREILSKLQMQVKKEVDNLEAQLESSSRSFQNSLNEMDFLTKKLEQNNTDKIKEMKVELQKFVDLLEIHTTKQSEFLASEKKIRDHVSTIQSAKSRINNEIYGVENKLNLYNNQKCPTCQGDLSSEFHVGVKNGLEGELTKLKEEFTGIDDQLKSARESEMNMEQKKKMFIEKGSKIRTQIDAMRSQMTLLSNEKVDEQLNSIKKIVEQLRSDIEDSGVNKTEKETKFNWYKILDEALSEKGIKQLAMQTLVPTFNSEIYKMMAEMHLNYQVLFDEQFDARVLHLGEEISPATLSAGESVKVDFVILIAFIRMLKMKFPSINIIFLDEMFANVDQDGIYVITKILRRITKELGMNIFVVAHNSLPTEMFEYKIDVQKANGFSNLSVHKLN